MSFRPGDNDIFGEEDIYYGDDDNLHKKRDL